MDDKNKVAAFQNRRGSPIRTRNHQPLKHITNDSNPVKEPETTPIGTENTAFTARSRTTPKKNAERESMKKKLAETNKDVPIGLKCI